MFKVTMTSHQPVRAKQQNGSALITSLSLLIVLTVIGISSMDTTVMEIKMAHNTTQRVIAYQAAETAITEAELWLDDTNNLKIINDLNKFNGTNGLYSSVLQANKLSWNTNKSANWSSANSKVANKLTSFGNFKDTDIPGPPRFVIEYLGRAGRPLLNYTSYDSRLHAFRITAIGFGTDGTSKYLLSSTFKKELL